MHADNSQKVRLHVELRERDEHTRDERVRRYLEINRQGIVPDHYSTSAKVDLCRSTRVTAM